MEIPAWVRKYSVMLAALVVALFTIVLTSPTVARANTVESPSWGSANLLSYADSDFESGIGNWVSSSNATLSQDTTSAFLHNDSLRMAATVAGTAAIKMGTGTSAPQINVTAGKTYRISAWLKTSQTGRTVAYAMGFFTSGGTWLGWTSATAKTLATSSGYQYVSETLTAPATAAYATGSPRLTETGMNAGEALNIDEMLVVPDRAAAVIGAKDPSTDQSQFTYTNNTIGPLQTDKVFYSGALPASYTGSQCDKLPANVTCMVAYKTQTTNVASFVGSIPAGRNTIIIYFQEPENNTFSGSGTNGQNFVSQFEGQANLIRANTTAANRPNVFVSDDAMAYQYGAGTSHNLGGAGGSCSFTVPSSYVDMYLVDLYIPNGASGNNIANDSYAKPLWTGWLGCVTPQNKPIGIAEYGLNGSYSPNYSNDPSTATEITADSAYLDTLNATQQVDIWAYWWYSNDANWQFTPAGQPSGQAAVTAWQAAETQNGGGQ